MYYLVRRSDNQVVSGNATIEGYYVNGMRVVAVPPNVGVDETNRTGPNNTLSFSDLLGEKYNGLLRQNPLFSSVQYDVFSDASGVAPTSEKVGSGEGVLWVGDTGALDTEPLSAMPNIERALVQWEVYSLDRVVEGTTAFVRYIPEDPSDLTVSITNTGNAGDLVATTSGNVVEFPTAGNGNVWVRFQNNSGKRLYLGGYAVLY